MDPTLYFLEMQDLIIIALTGSAALLSAAIINVSLYLKIRKNENLIKQQKDLIIKNLQTLALLEKEIAEKKIDKGAFDYQFSSN